MDGLSKPSINLHFRTVFFKPSGIIDIKKKMVTKIAWIKKIIIIIIIIDSLKKNRPEM